MKKCLRQKCGKEFEPSKPKQVYCSTKCRTYAFREIIQQERKKPKPELMPEISSYYLPKVGDVKEQTKIAISNKPEIPPMPTRMIGEDALDFAARKNEWKKKYNQ
jgi:hypothetical protein